METRRRPAMLIVFYVVLVWLKIVIGTTMVFLWLWVVRDRDMHGVLAALNYIAALALWLAPWILFLWSESDFYQGHCGLRQGIYTCTLLEFLWTRLRWVRLGFVLDLSLLAGVLFVIFRARVARDDSRAYG
jgi:hypothetical protein